MITVDSIRELIYSLPKSDIQYCINFLSNRDFDSLLEIIDSDIYKINKNLDSDIPKKEYLELDADKINRLKSEVVNYMANLDLSNLDNNNDEDDDSIRSSIYEDDYE